MTEDYSRKQNTNNFQTTIAGCVNEGEAILEQHKANINSFQDVVTRKDTVDKWVGKIGGKIEGIYKAHEVAREIVGGNSFVDLILEHLPRDQAIGILNEIVQERIERLHVLVDRTRSFSPPPTH